MVTRTQGPLVSVIAAASLAAGLVHAAAAGTHAEERQAAIVFAAIAVFQIAWAAWIWTQPSRLAFGAGAVVNLACIATWCLAKVSGVPFIEGLGHTEKLQFADAWASAVELVIVLGAAWLLTAGRAESEEGGAPRALSWGIAGVLLIGTGPAMVAPHEHSSEGTAHTHTGEVAAADPSADAHDHDHSSADASNEGPTSDASKALGAVHDHLSADGTMPTEKPTKKEQARADLLVSETGTALAAFADARIETSVENGRFIRIPGSTDIFRSIRDTSGAFEHFVNWDRLDDGKVVDPSAIESIVVQTKDGASKVVAAMYVLPSGTLAGNEPAVGGPLTMWHVHDNLCFNADREVAGTWSKAAGCPTGSTHWITAPMLHVWNEDTPCGRFAELDGPAIAGGTCGAMDMGSHSHAHSAGATAADSTPAELKQERKLIAETKAAVAKYVSTEDAVAAGYVSIGDSMTGFEHFVNGEYLKDEYTLDPAHVESLVYRVDGAAKTLISGMYILENGSMMSDVPDLGGPRVMWHIHTDLCWGAPGKLGGVMRNGRCRPGGTLGVTSPMLHVWVVPNECGPFAGIEAKQATGCSHEVPRITGPLGSPVAQRAGPVS